MKASDISEREMLEAYETWRIGQRVAPWEPFAQRFPEKVVHAKMEKLYRKGYIEYGVSLRTGFLTPQGYERLKVLRGL